MIKQVSDGRAVARGRRVKLVVVDVGDQLGQPPRGRLRSSIWPVPRCVVTAYNVTTPRNSSAIQPGPGGEHGLGPAANAAAVS